MALVSLSAPFAYPYWFGSQSAMSISQQSLSSSGNYVAGVFAAPKTGNISAIGYFPGTVSSPSADVRLETVDSSGLPSGTLWGTNTNASHTPSASTWAWVTLTASAAVNKGDIICIKIARSSGTFQVNYWNPAPVIGFFPYGVFNTGTPSRSTACPILAVKYDDNTYPFMFSFPLGNTGLAQAINSGTTPDEKGVKFTVPFACKVSGACFRYVAPSGSTTYTLKLYDGSDNVLASVLVDTDAQATINSTGQIVSLFNTDVQLSPGSTYRLTILPTDATNFNFFRAILDAATTREAWPHGTSWQATERTDAGSWTDTDTQMPLMSLMLSALDDGNSAGGILVNPGLKGGLM